MQCIRELDLNEIEAVGGGNLVAQTYAVAAALRAAAAAAAKAIEDHGSCISPMSPAYRVGKDNC